MQDVVDEYLRFIQLEKSCPKIQSQHIDEI